MIDYTVVRTNRKSIAIYVRPNGRVEVRCSKRTPRAVLDRVVEKKQDWIFSCLAKLRERERARAEYALVPGAEIDFLGNSYSLREAESKTVHGYLKGRTIYLPRVSGEEERRHALIAFYRAQAASILPVKCRRFAALMGTDYTRLTVSGAKTRWASCSSNGSLHFSWRLMLAPEPAVDYVVVHELAHRFQPNHSPAFWTIVEKFCPDWRRRRLELKEVSRRLSEQGWDQF